MALSALKSNKESGCIERPDDRIPRLEIEPGVKPGESLPHSRCLLPYSLDGPLLDHSCSPWQKVRPASLVC
jgi:hypothetical protein